MRRSNPRWQRTTLRPLLKGYIGGGWGEELQDESSSEQAAVIRGTDIPAARVGNLQSVPFRFHKKSNLRSRKLQPGDVILEVSGGSKDQPVGRALYCSDKLLTALGGDAIPASFCKRIEPDPEKVDGKFLYFFLKAIYDDRRISQWQVQSTGISNFQFEAFLDECDIDLPTLNDQGRIASILSAYDDLIENNTRRIAILEEMARRIYEEWFVRFRFPGYEGVKMVESGQGTIPQGWKVSTLNDLSAYINRGLTPKYEDEADGLVVNQKCIREQRLSLEPARRQSKPIPAEKRLRYGDVLINSTGVGTLGRVAQVIREIENCTVDTHVTIVRPRSDVDPNWFGMTLLSLQPYFEEQGVGATGQTELGRGRIAETRIITAPPDIQAQFASLVSPLRELARTLGVKNLNLRTTRDLLLPKLITGEIDVSNFPEPEAIAA